MKESKSIPEMLLKGLSDESYAVWVREEAAEDLQIYDESFVEEGLFAFCSDVSQHQDILQEAAHSLLTILQRKGKVDLINYQSLAPTAAKTILNRLKGEF